MAADRIRVWTCGRCGAQSLDPPRGIAHLRGTRLLNDKDSNCFGTVTERVYVPAGDKPDREAERAALEELAHQERLEAAARERGDTDAFTRDEPDREAMVERAAQALASMYMEYDVDDNYIAEARAVVDALYPPKP